MYTQIQSMHSSCSERLKVFEFAKNALLFYSGHSDELSCQTAKLLLGSPKKYKRAEIIYASGCVFTRHCIFTLCGAHYNNICLNGVAIEQNRVYEAHKGDSLKFSGLELGFRLYLMASTFKAGRLGCYRQSFERCFTPAKVKIRVIKGPEFDYLNDAGEFLDRPFVISANSDLSGLRLEGKKIAARQYDIISSIVADGLVQLTATGPIVLLRQRQLTGGYPRIFSIIKTDLDFLAQYQVGAVVRFELIDINAAKALLLQREIELNTIRFPCSA